MLELLLWPFIAGLVLTGSPFPPERGVWPHPAVIAGFAAYDAPGLGPLMRSGPDHLLWGSILAYVLTRGAGRLSVDHLIARRLGLA